MRHFIIFLLLIALSCNKEEVLVNEEDVIELDCQVMNPIGLFVSPLDQSALLGFGSSFIWDGPFVACSPEEYIIYVSDDGIDFRKLTIVDGSTNSHLVENLENEETYFFRVTALHSELDAVLSQIVTVKTGLIPLPSFINNPLANNFELFRLNPDGDQFLYRSSSDDWYVSSFSNPVQGEKVVDDSFSAKWNPHNTNEITYRAKQYVEISGSTNGITSKSLSTVNLEDGTEDLLHEVSDYMDFGNEHQPEQYWIHNFNYSLDETSLFFESNKDNGSSTRYEKEVFNNIWKLDLVTKDLQKITDFLAVNFKMKSFVEDPKSPGDFYVLGGTSGEVVEIEGAPTTHERVDVYYYDSEAKSLSLVLETIYEEDFLDINPAGNKLLIINGATGQDELWRYDLISESLDQVTQSHQYSYNKYRFEPNWISETEFMVPLYHEGELKLASFNIGE